MSHKTVRLCSPLFKSSAKLFSANSRPVLLRLGTRLGLGSFDSRAVNASCLATRQCVYRWLIANVNGRAGNIVLSRGTRAQDGQAVVGISSRESLRGFNAGDPVQSIFISYGQSSRLLPGFCQRWQAGGKQGRFLFRSQRVSLFFLFLRERKRKPWYTAGSPETQPPELAASAKGTEGREPLRPTSPRAVPTAQDGPGRPAAHLRTRRRVLSPKNKRKAMPGGQKPGRRGQENRGSSNDSPSPGVP